ncbi:MAG: alginate O-acetyltransferase AlgX-related protein [Armatimonadota bacterium]
MSNTHDIKQNPDRPLEREEEAKLWLENTKISLPAAWFMIACLLFTIMLVPMVQIVKEARDASGLRAKQVSDGNKFPTFNILRLAPDLNAIKNAQGMMNYIALLPTPKAISSYEGTIEDESVIANWIQSRVQFILTRGFGVGNEQAYKGHDNWLFYRSDVDYVIGRGFLQPKRKSAIVNDLDKRFADPVEAIVKFDRELKARGIQLIVMPAAMKPSIYPEYFSSRYGNNSQVVQNASYNQFVEILRDKGIPVFDTGSVLLNAKQHTENPLFLESDTHWSPEAVGIIADELRNFIQKNAQFSEIKPVKYSRHKIKHKGIGDTAVMLRLPEGRDSNYYTTVELNQVKTGKSNWTPDTKADILMLGDSFSNIYSLKGMGWGESAGLVEQLSYLLQRPVDKISINAGGAYATREELKRQLLRNPHRLDGKRVVVYEFAARELSSSNWKIIDLPDAPPSKAAAEPEKVETATENAQEKLTPEVISPETAVEKPSAPAVVKTPNPVTKPVNPAPVKPAPVPAKPVDNQIVVQAVIADISEVPEPGTVPYSDCVIAVHLKSIKVLDGQLSQKEIAVFIWGMRDNKLTSASSYKSGQNIKLKLTPWDKVESRYGSYNRVELEDDNLLFLEVFWGEGAK